MLVNTKSMGTGLLSPQRSQNSKLSLLRGAIPEGHGRLVILRQERPLLDPGPISGPILMRRSHLLTKVRMGALHRSAIFALRRVAKQGISPKSGSLACLLPTLLVEMAALVTAMLLAEVPRVAFSLRKRGIPVPGMELLAKEAEEAAEEYPVLGMLGFFLLVGEFLPEHRLLPQLMAERDRLPLTTDLSTEFLGQGCGVVIQRTCRSTT